MLTYSLQADSIETIANYKKFLEILVSLFFMQMFWNSLDKMNFIYNSVSSFAQSNIYVQIHSSAAFIKIHIIILITYVP